MKETAENMKATGFEPMGMNAAKEKLQRRLDGCIADARDRLRSSAQCESTVLALNDLLNETQKKAILLVADNDRLRAANARLQAWHDAVMGQESTVSQYYDAIGRRHFTRLGETFEQIGYQCQPLIIRPQPLAKE